MKICINIAMKLLAVVENGLLMGGEGRWGGAFMGAEGSSRLRWWAGGARRSLGMVSSLR